MKSVKGLEHNTTIKYIVNFKKIIRIAYANEWITKDPFFSLEGLMENERKTIPDPKGTRYAAEPEIVYATARAGTGYIPFLLLYGSGLFRCKAIAVRAHCHRHQWRPLDKNGPEKNQGDDSIPLCLRPKG